MGFVLHFARGLFFGNRLRLALGSSYSVPSIFFPSRHTADLLTSAEGTLSTERVQELQARVDELSAALSQERKEHVLTQEKEKANTSELRLEIGKLKARLEDTIRAHKAALRNRTRRNRNFLTSGTGTVPVTGSKVGTGTRYKIMYLIFFS